jgi:hypothetical protein
LGPADLAYAAALIDNLASLRVRTLGQSRLPVVEISGKYAGLPWLGEVTGTKVVETKRNYSRHNCTQHCPSAHAEIKSYSMRWSITGMRASIVLHNVLPFLRVQADDAHALMDYGLTLSYKGQVVNDLAKIGWKIPDLPAHPRARVPLEIVT